MPSFESVSTPLLQLYPLNKDRPKRTQILEDLLDFTKNGKQPAVNEIIGMLYELHEKGRHSARLYKLQGLPLFELKPNSRGGHRGGARVYLAFNDNNEAIILNAEVKPQDISLPDPAKITEALRMLNAYREGSLKSAPNTNAQERWRP